MSRARTASLFLSLAAIWGSAFVAIKAGLASFPPVLFAAFRYDVAAVLVLAYAVRTTDRVRPRTAAEWRLVAVGAVFMIAGYHAFLFVGEQGTTSAAAAVVVGLSPVLTAGFAGLVLPEERLALPGLVGLLLGFVGVAVVARPDPSTFLAAGRAELLVLGAALSFAVGSVLARRSPASLPVETMEAWSMVGGALLLHVASLALGESVAAVRWTTGGIAALAYLALVASAAGFLLYFALLDRLGPTRINLVSYVAPVFAALSGWFVLGESVDAATAAGFAVIVAGFALVQRAELAAALRRP